MTFSRLSVVFMKCKADKSERHQDGSSYYQPMRIFHAEPPSRSSFLRLQPRARPDEVVDAQGIGFLHNKPDDFVLRHRVALSYSGGKRQQIKRQCCLWHL